MVPDAWVYRAANRLMSQHGADALEEVNRLICDALDYREQDRAVLMVRIRLAILVLQTPPQGPLHWDRSVRSGPRQWFQQVPGLRQLRTGSADMWDQLTPADFQRGRHVLNLRRADTLRRHAAEFMQLQAKQATEIEALDEKYAQIDALEAVVENLAHELTPERDTVVRAYATSMAALNRGTVRY